MSSDFSITNIHEHINVDDYLKVIKTAKHNGYKYINYADYEKYDKFIIMRHDIDLDLHYALKMAQIEHENDVQSTFFVMLRNPLYNPLAIEHVQIISDMQRMGHTIGLHFDPTFYQGDNTIEFNVLLELIKAEIEILSSIANQKVYFVSFHQPVENLLGRDVIMDGVFESTYNKKYFNDIRYIADSCGRWREESILELIEKNTTQKIQFLSHPALWFDREALVLRDRISCVLENRKARLEKECRRTINNYTQGVILYE
ncbi:hypothetical protein ACFL47_01245 [Candidatus Latescibacterota bacterium]